MITLPKYGLLSIDEAKLRSKSKSDKHYIYKLLTHLVWNSGYFALDESMETLNGIIPDAVAIVNSMDPLNGDGPLMMKSMVNTLIQLTVLNETTKAKLKLLGWKL